MTERRSDEDYWWPVLCGVQSGFSSNYRSLKDAMSSLRAEERLAARVEFAEEIIAKACALTFREFPGSATITDAAAQRLRALARQPGPAKEEE